MVDAVAVNCLRNTLITPVISSRILFQSTVTSARGVTLLEKKEEEKRTEKHRGISPASATGAASSYGRCCDHHSLSVTVLPLSAAEGCSVHGQVGAWRCDPSTEKKKEKTENKQRGILCLSSPGCLVVWSMLQSSRLFDTFFSVGCSGGRCM